MSARRREPRGKVKTIYEMLGGKPENIQGIATESYYTDPGTVQQIQPVTVDYSRIDYTAFDLLYRARLGGFELGGLLAKVIIGHICNFILDRDISVRVDEPMVPITDTADNPILSQVPDERLEGMVGQNTLPPMEESYTNKVFRAWSRRFTPMFKDVIEDTLKFGDMFTVVNDDGSFTNVPPTNVNKIIDPYSGKVTGFEVFTVVTERIGTQNVRIIYRETRMADRIVTERKPLDRPDRPGAWQIATNIEGAVRPNPIGILDVVHWFNDKKSYDAYGYSELYSLLTILRRYDDLLNWGITGNKLMGRPSPVFEGIRNVAEFQRMYGRTVTGPDGRDHSVIDWKPEQVIVLGDGGSFKLASPQPFASDTKTILSLLFWIITQHSNVPEFIWGTAMNSNKASVQEQLQPFIKFVEKKRQQFEGYPADPLLGAVAEGGIHELAEIWRRKRRLTDSQVNIDVPTIVTWPNIASKESELVRRVVEWLFSQGLISEETSLEISNSLMGDPIPNVVEELQLARAEAKKRQEQALLNQIERGVDAPFGQEEDGSPAPNPGTADGTESGVENDNPGDNQFTGQDE